MVNNFRSLHYEKFKEIPGFQALNITGSFKDPTYKLENLFTLIGNSSYNSLNTTGQFKALIYNLENLLLLL